jgi:hypothetical protein
VGATRILLSLFLIAHGAVHLLYLAPVPEDDPAYPFVPERGWLARRLRLEPAAAKRLAGWLAVPTALVLAFGGVALIVGGGMWEAAAVVGAGLSLVLLLAFFHRWLLIGIAIDIAIVADVLWLHIPASSF